MNVIYAMRRYWEGEGRARGGLEWLSVGCDKMKRIEELMKTTLGLDSCSYC